MPYLQLNEHSVVDYLRSITSLNPLITTRTSAKEVGDGNINFVYMVEQLAGPTQLVVKQAVPYLRCVGEQYSLAKERMLYESRALQHFANLAPKHVPTVYHVDSEMSLVVMQCLDNHIIMRRGLMAETVYPKFAEHIASFMAEVLFKTSSLFLTGKEKRALMQQYVSNDELCKITEDFVFTCPYMIHPTNPENKALAAAAQAIQQDQAFKLEALALKNKFMNQTDALVHGDLHTGSIMINAEETYVIDPEFAFFGPFGFDLGALLANFVLAWVSHFERSQNAAYQKWLLDTAIQFYQQFEKNFLTLWNQHEQDSGLLTRGYCDTPLLAAFQKKYLLDILQDAIGFAGLKMARRILGIAGVADIREISNQAARTRAELFALNIAQQFVLKRKTIQKITDILPLLEQAQHHYEQQKNYQTADYPSR